MILGIGCDITEHKIARKLNWDKDSVLQNSIFSESELSIPHNNRTIEFLCGRFSAKEAVAKCLKTGFVESCSALEIEILSSESGAPYINLSGNAKKIADGIGVGEWQVSISHSKDYSISFVIALKN